MSTPAFQTKIEGSRTIRRENAEYFGLAVQLILQLEYSSLVQYGNRQFVVDSADLSCETAMKCVA